MTGTKTIPLLIAVFLCLATQAQRSANWFFGDHAGIRFTATGVINLSGSALKTEEGCATISDTAGNLLFYTDGSTVYNRNHIVMAGGTGLMGNISSSQSSIIVPMPGSDSLYYIFTAAVPSFTARYYYNIVDMSLQGGFGEVIQKNISLSNDMSSERITAIQHRNRRDFWIITNPVGTSVFKAFQLTSSGVQINPSITNIGYVPPTGYGMIKGSPDGQMLVQTASFSSNMPFPSSPSTQIFRFDAANGYLFKPISLFSPQSTYGCAFSPNSEKLYLTSGFPNPSIGGPLSQFTVSSYDSASINNSFYAFNITTPGGWGDISLGPDSVLYISRCLEKKLSAIKNPNADGPSCTFVDVAVALSGKCIFGLPNFYNNINNPPFYIDVQQQGCMEFLFSFHTNYQGTGSYSWDFGDGHFSSDSAPVHTYVRNNNDSFLVTFYFRSADMSVKTYLQQWVTLPPKPEAVFTAQTNGCVGNTVAITNNSTGNGTPVFHWNFGDHTTSSQQNPVKRYADSGTYTIQLSVVDSLGCKSDTAFAIVAVNKKAIAAFILSGDQCENKTLAIADASAAWNTTINEWRYDIGNGWISSTTPLPSTSFSTPGTYEIKLVTVADAGCTSDTAKQSINIYERPVAGFIMPENCVTDLSSFTDTSKAGASAITSWEWNFDDLSAAISTSVLQHPSHQYSDARSYNVQLIVASNHGCKDTVVQVFTVNGAAPKAALNFVQDPVCSGDAVVLVNSSSVNFGKLTSLQVDWTSSNVSIDLSPAGGKQYSHHYPVFGMPATSVQPIRLTVQSGASCISVLDTFITLKAHPLLDIQAIAPVCADAAAFILSQGSVINNATGTAQYSGIGVQQNPSGSYMFFPAQVQGNKALIEYSFTTPGGCTADTVQTINILPKPIVSAGHDQSVLSGKTVQLNGSSNGVTHQWLPPIWLSDVTSLAPLATPLNDIAYTLVSTSADGCIDSASVQLRVLQSISIPNAFSPNGDGINDSWEIANLSRYPKPTVQVYDRWGRLVFQSTGYARAWKGTSINNIPLPLGVYYYVIIPGETNERFTGWVMLLK